MKLSLVGGIFVLLGLTVLVKKTIDKYEKEAQISPTVLPQNVLTIPEKKENIVVEEPTQETEKKEEPPKDNKVAEITPPKLEPPPAPKPTPEPEPKKPVVEPIKVAETKPEPPPIKKVEDKKPAPNPSVVKKVQKKSPPLSTTFKGQELIIEALDKVNISYTIDGRKVESVNLEADKVFTLKAKNKISLNLNNGGVVSIIHNGKDLGVPGAIGKSYKRSFP